MYSDRFFFFGILARSTTNRIQDIRDLVGKRVQEKLQENEIRRINAGRPQQHVQSRCCGVFESA